MFICQPCATKENIDSFWFTAGPLSRGNCEMCETYSICLDWQSYKKEHQSNGDTELTKALSILVRYLSVDKSPGSYYHTWQSNIAMAFHDELFMHEFGGIIDINKSEALLVCNKAAERFLRTLMLDANK